jgi:hypothetical protein
LLREAGGFFIVLAVAVVFALSFAVAQSPVSHFTASGD